MTGLIDALVFVISEYSVHGVSVAPSFTAALQLAHNRVQPGKDIWICGRYIYNKYTSTISSCSRRVWFNQEGGIAGGTRTYEEAFPLSKYLYMTLVRRHDGEPIQGDTYFPPQWQQYFPPQTLIHSQEVHDNPIYHFTFHIYDRTRGVGVS